MSSDESRKRKREASVEIRPPGKNRYVPVAGDDQWLVESGEYEWMYNVEEEVYFHAPSGKIFDAKGASVDDLLEAEATAASLDPTRTLPDDVEEACEEESEESDDEDDDDDDDDNDDEDNGDEKEDAGNPSSPSPTAGKVISLEMAEPSVKSVLSISLASDGEENEVVSEAGDSDAESEVEFDVERSLAFASHQAAGPNKATMEDRVVDRHSVPMGAIYNSESFCTMSAVYDGHGGFSCAEYCSQHLINNVIGSYRSLRLRKKKLPYISMAKCVRHGDLMRKLAHAMIHGFSMTEKNYSEMVKRKKGQDDGTTALVSALFGPDEDGTMKCMTAHVGDSRAVAFNASKGVRRLTEDHKPDVAEERERIEKNGGVVAKIQGVWRVLTRPENSQTFIGLAVSRTLGDFRLKVPLPLVEAEPSIGIHQLDLQSDLFILMASDGLWDVFTDEAAALFIANHLRESRDKDAIKSAARTLVDAAKARGSEDDITVLVQLLDNQESWSLWQPDLPDTASANSAEDSDGMFGAHDPDKNIRTPRASGGASS